MTLSSIMIEISRVSRDHVGNTNDRKLDTIIFFFLRHDAHLGCFSFLNLNKHILLLSNKLDVVM